MKYWMILLMLVSGAVQSAFNSKDARVFDELTAVPLFSEAMSVYKKYSEEYNPNDKFDFFPRAGAYSGWYLDLMTVEARETIANRCDEIYMNNTFELYPKALTEDGLRRIYKSERYEVNSRGHSRNGYLTQTIDVDKEGEDVVIDEVKHTSLMIPEPNGTSITVYDKINSEVLEDFSYDFKLTSEIGYLGALVQSFRDGNQNLDTDVINLSSPNAYRKVVSRIAMFKTNGLTLWKVKATSTESNSSSVQTSAFYTVYGKDGTRLAQMRTSGDNAIITYLYKLIQDESLLCE